MTRFKVPTRDFAVALEYSIAEEDQEQIFHLLNDFAFADDFVIAARPVDVRKLED